MAFPHCWRQAAEPASRVDGQIHQWMGGGCFPEDGIHSPLARFHQPCVGLDRRATRRNRSTYPFRSGRLRSGAWIHAASACLPGFSSGRRIRGRLKRRLDSSAPAGDGDPLTRVVSRYSPGCVDSPSVRHALAGFPCVREDIPEPGQIGGKPDLERPWARWTGRRSGGWSG